MLSQEQLQRYARNIIIPEIGKAGQENLLAAKVLIAGCGGLGSACAYYLAAAGCGTIGVADFDTVDLDNLQRQILHTTKDVGILKVDSAKKKLTDINPDIKINCYQERLSKTNISNIINDYDLLVECSDNFSTKYLLNDMAVSAKKPLFYAAVSKFEGQATTIMPDLSACLRCIFNEEPKEKDLISPKDSGILGPVAGIGGLIQANEVIKYVLGLGQLLTDTIFSFDVLSMDFKKIGVKKDPDCSICK